MTKRASFHENFGRKETIEVSSNRAFGVVIAAGATLIGGVKLWSGNALAVWWFVGAAAFLGVALVRPAALAPLNRLWFKFGLLLFNVLNPLVMGLLFYLCVTPVGLLMRMLGKDLLRLGSDREAKSYWIERRPPGPAPDTMRNQF